MDTQPRWERRWVEDFSQRFVEIARLADKGDDRGYGNGLAVLMNDCESFIKETIQADRAHLAEEMEKLIHPDEDTEYLGWEMAMGDRCCPGDDAWHGYETGVKAAKALLRKTP